MFPLNSTRFPLARTRVLPVILETIGEGTGCRTMRAVRKRRRWAVDHGLPLCVPWQPEGQAHLTRPGLSFPAFKFMSHCPVGTERGDLGTDGCLCLLSVGVHEGPSATLMFALVQTVNLKPPLVRKQQNEQEVAQPAKATDYHLPGCESESGSAPVPPPLHPRPTCTLGPPALEPPLENSGGSPIRLRGVDVRGGRLLL